MFPMFSSNAKIAWDEPMFYRIRNYGPVAWAIRGSLFVGFFTLFAVVLAFDKARTHSILEILLFPLFLACFFAFLLELPTLQRKVQISDSGISYMGALAFIAAGNPLLAFYGSGNWAPASLKSVRFLRSGERENAFRFDLMVLTPKHSRPVIIGVPSTVSVDEISTALISIGVPVDVTRDGEVWGCPMS